MDTREDNDEECCFLCRGPIDLYQVLQLQTTNANADNIGNGNGNGSDNVNANIRKYLEYISLKTTDNDNIGGLTICQQCQALLKTFSEGFEALEKARVKVNATVKDICKVMLEGDQEEEHFGVGTLRERIVDKSMSLLEKAISSANLPVVPPAQEPSSRDTVPDSLLNHSLASPAHPPVQEEEEASSGDTDPDIPSPSNYSMAMAIATPSSRMVTRLRKQQEQAYQSNSTARTRTPLTSSGSRANGNGNGNDAETETVTPRTKRYSRRLQLTPPPSLPQGSLPDFITEIGKTVAYGTKQPLYNCAICQKDFPSVCLSHHKGHPVGVDEVPLDLDSDNSSSSSSPPPEVSEEREAEADDSDSESEPEIVVEEMNGNWKAPRIPKRSPAPASTDVISETVQDYEPGPNGNSTQSDSMIEIDNDNDKPPGPKDLNDLVRQGLDLNDFFVRPKEPTSSRVNKDGRGRDRGEPEPESESEDDMELYHRNLQALEASSTSVSFVAESSFALHSDSDSGEDRSSDSNDSELSVEVENGNAEPFPSIPRPASPAPLAFVEDTNVANHPDPDPVENEDRNSEVSVDDDDNDAPPPKPALPEAVSMVADSNAAIAIHSDLNREVSQELSQNGHQKSSSPPGHASSVPFKASQVLEKAPASSTHVNANSSPVIHTQTRPCKVVVTDLNAAAVEPEHVNGEMNTNQLCKVKPLPLPLRKKSPSTEEENGSPSKKLFAVDPSSGPGTSGPDSLPDFITLKGKIFKYNRNHKLFYCSLCEVDVVGTDLYRHKQRHGIGLDVCKTCGKTFAVKTFFLKHVEKANCTSKSSSSSDDSDNDSDIRSNASSSQEKKKIEKKFVPLTELPEFITQKGTTFIYGKTFKLYHCSICKKDVTAPNLHRHKMRHGIGVDVCKTCGKSFTNKATYLNHVKKDSCKGNGSAAAATA